MNLSISLAIALTSLAACGPSTTGPGTLATPSGPIALDKNIEPKPTLAPTTCAAIEAGPEAEASGASFEAMSNELIGGVRIGSTRSEATAIVGAPASVDGPNPNEVEGGLSWTLNYDDGAMTVVVGSEKDWEAAVVTAITIAKNSELKTRFGIGIGSAEADVRKAYSPCIDAEMSSADQIIAGSVYGGVFFTIKDGAVTEIFVGAGAE